ncbi:hypothetical protein H2200_009304 [Cladophialophora chaetospira]|uniref:Uncharacterized protein n=1 Tax=Cladophialophora chaetospira TaxID=386627 RepID=A0AA38X455_9EURO|nr:hypothetical protein H2200_009304 [Cladophialophora chaetospira]
MSISRSLSKDMLHAYLYSTNNLIDYLVHTHTRTLRNNQDDKIGDSTTTHTTSTQQKSKEKKKDEAVVRKLEADMTKLTDSTLLHDARAYQQGLKEGRRSYLY